MQKSWEKIVLSVSLVLLALAAVALALLFPSREDLTSSTTTSVTGSSVPKIDPKSVEEVAKGWISAPKWDENKHQLFLSDKYLYDLKDGKITRASDDTNIEGMTLQWLQANNLDIKSSTIASEDPDNDGFSNLIEYKYKTDPRDKTSHPPYIALLRLKSFDTIPFRIRFQSYNDIEGEKVFVINLLDSRRSRLVKIGEKLEGYTVTHYEHKTNKKVNPATPDIVEEVDESELTLEKPDINFKINLVFNKTIDSPESTARLIMLLPGKLNSEIVAPRGKEFEIPEEPGIKYLLMRADDTGALIRNLTTKEEIQVPKVSPVDLAGVPQQPKADTKAEKKN